MIRVLICDDQEMVTEGLRVILNTAPDIEVVGVAHGGEEVVALTPELKPDVILMDLKMPGVNGIQATQLIRQKHPDVHVLVLTTYDADEWVFDAIRNGAHGYLLKDTPRRELMDAIRGTAAGKTHVDPNVAGKLFTQIAQQNMAPTDMSLIQELSTREGEVLRLLARGLNNAEIAQRLFLSEGTIRNYVSAILTKLDVTDRTQAAVFALRHGLAGTEDL